MSKNVIVVIGAGLIGQAIVRRISAGKHVVLADLRQENADIPAKILTDAGFEVTTTLVDVSSRQSVEALVSKVSTHSVTIKPVTSALLNDFSDNSFIIASDIKIGTIPITLTINQPYKNSEITDPICSERS